MLPILPVGGQMHLALLYHTGYSGPIAQPRINFNTDAHCYHCHMGTAMDGYNILCHTGLSRHL